MFSRHSLQASVSPNPSEIILICWCITQVIFIIIINVEDNVVLLNCLWDLENDTFLFSGFFKDYVKKNSIYLKHKYFSNIKMYLLLLLIKLMCPCRIKLIKFHFWKRIKNITLLTQHTFFSSQWTKLDGAVTVSNSRGKPTWARIHKTF